MTNPTPPKAIELEIDKIITRELQEYEEMKDIDLEAKRNAKVGITQGIVAYIAQNYRPTSDILKAIGEKKQRTKMHAIESKTDFFTDGKQVGYNQAIDVIKQRLGL